MINFSCPSCQKRFSVDNALGGKRFRCKACQNPLQVPMLATTSAAPPPPPAPPRPPAAPSRSTSYDAAPPVPLFSDELTEEFGAPVPLAPAPTPMQSSKVIVGTAPRSGGSFFRRWSRPKWEGETVYNSGGIGDAIAGYARRMVLRYVAIFLIASAILILQRVSRVQVPSLWHHHSEAQADSSESNRSSSSATSSAAPASTGSGFLSAIVSAPFVENGVEIYKVTLSGVGPIFPMEARLYLPEGRHEPGALPCVFIAPAGTPQIYGSRIGDFPKGDDSPEHLPYAKAGFAVVAYELSGDVPDHEHAMLKDLVEPIGRYIAADGGRANARAAVDFVLKNVPEVDSSRLYAVGHSSAATVALNVAAADHRIKAVAAYAPRTEVVEHVKEITPYLKKHVQDFVFFIHSIEPAEHARLINCPVLLFHADDDGVVPTSDNIHFADAMALAGNPVQFQRTAHGNHYQSMIDEGIPTGIRFLIAHGADPRPPISAASAIASAPAGQRPGWPTLIHITPGAPPADPSRHFPPADASIVTMPPAPDDGGPSWETDPAQLNQLDGETPVGDYLVRPPTGMIQSTSQLPHDTTEIEWKDDAGRAKMCISFAPRMDQNAYPYIMTRSGRGPENVHSMRVVMGAQIDYGHIGGMNFVRARRPGGQYTIYTAYDDRKSVAIIIEAPDRATLDMLEASARSLRKKK